MKRISLIACAALLAIGAVTLAVAQTVEPSAKVDAGGGIFAALQPYIVDGAGVLITAFIGWAATKFSAKTGIEIDAKHRDALHSAIVTGINLGLSRVGEKIEGKPVTASNAVVADAMNWVNKSVPDALDRFKVTPDTLRTMVEAKIPQVTGATAPVAAPSKT